MWSRGWGTRLGSLEGLRPIMPDIDITVFAELLVSRFGLKATAEAQRRARLCHLEGDEKNARAWRLILQHVRQLQAGGLVQEAVPARQ